MCSDSKLQQWLNDKNQKKLFQKSESNNSVNIEILMDG